jgi:putative DNA primase/helicase
MIDGGQYHDNVTRVYAFDIRVVARALGGEVIGPAKVAAPGPGHSARDRSLVVTLDANAPDGFVVFSHAGDDWQLCKDHVRQQLGLPQWRPGDGRDRRVEPSRLKAFDRAAVNAESKRRERSEDELARIAHARAIWDEAVDPRGTLVEQYLASRKLTLADDVAVTVLRFHPACPWRDENTGTIVGMPALLAAFTSIDDSAVTAVQRVALTTDGKKIGRRMLGVVHRSAVKLAPAGEVLHIGEGVETCLAARQLGHAPAWALGSVGAITKFPLLEGVTCLRILGETGEASADAIKLCGERWHAAGRKVQVVMPEVGDDLNDQLMAIAS